MRLLTGSTLPVMVESEPFVFVPLSIVVFGSTVIVEGGQESGGSWVHAWTVNGDGVITQVREYFNTSVTVTRFGTAELGSPEVVGSPRDVITAANCHSLWESKLCDDKSVPGLVLAL